MRNVKEYQSIRAYKFISGKEMLGELECADLYSPTLQMYVFLYNEAGAIAYYNIDPDKAIELAHEVQKYNEYWSAFLGVGGWICDDPCDENFPPSPGNSNLDFCNEYYRDFWINTEDVLEYYNDQRGDDNE